MTEKQRGAAKGGRQRDLSEWNKKAGKTWTSPSHMKFSLIPAGTFMMGFEEFEDAPPHKVTISNPFCLGKCPVTQKEWVKIMGYNPSKFKGNDRPVEMVSWDECLEFIEKLNAKEGTARYRLPTEAEWEYACRAGSPAGTCFEDEEDTLSKYAWFRDNAEEQSHPVGKLKPNAWNLYDMFGNVWEWCHDWYAEYDNGPVTDPPGPELATLKVIRGGGRSSKSKDCGSAYRVCLNPERKSHTIGFRLLREL